MDVMCRLKRACAQSLHLPVWNENVKKMWHQFHWRLYKIGNDKWLGPESEVASMGHGEDGEGPAKGERSPWRFIIIIIIITILATPLRQLTTLQLKMADPYVMLMMLRRQGRRALRRERIFRDRVNPLDKSDDVELIRKFRFRRADIMSIVDDVQDELQHVNRPGSVPPTPSLQVCLALRFSACGRFQGVCGELLVCFTA